MKPDETISIPTPGQRHTLHLSDGLLPVTITAVNIRGPELAITVECAWMHDGSRKTAWFTLAELRAMQRRASGARLCGQGTYGGMPPLRGKKGRFLASFSTLFSGYAGANRKDGEPCGLVS